MQDNEKIDTFVGRNASYYREKWKKYHEKPGFAASFNLAACLSQVVWLAYRRLYVPLFWAVVILVADVLLWMYVEDKQLVSENLSTAWSWFAVITLLVVFGYFSNYWYWRKFLEVERQAAALLPDRNAQLRFIRSKGGTSLVAASLVTLVLLMPIVWGVYWGVYQASRIDYSSYIFDAAGPLTLEEIEANFLNFMDEPLTGTRRECVFRELDDRARAAGDPETLDPTTVEHLPADGWDRLDPEGKRLILTQAITTGAFFACIRSDDSTAASSTTTGSKKLIVAGDPRFDIFELSNSAGDGTFASRHGTVVLSFLARDSRYCRAARFSLDNTFVLACRNDSGWQVEAVSSLAAGESINLTVFGGVGMNDVQGAIQDLKSGSDLLDEQEIIEAASKGWRQDKTVK